MIDVFAYGSLINLESAYKTIGRSIGHSDIKAVRLNNYTRIWNYKSRIYSEHLNKEATAVYLNLICTPGKFVNGIVFKVNDEEFEKLKKRESNYDIVDVSKEIGFNLSPVMAFICADDKYLSTPAEDVIVMEKYIEMVRTGCLEISKIFYEEYLATTKPYTYPTISGNYKFL
jgi:cation transport regulator ChaC